MPELSQLPVPISQSSRVIRRIGCSPKTPANEIGAFVDLAYSSTPPLPPIGLDDNLADFENWFSGTASFKSRCNYPYQLDVSRFENVYDTWTPYYEADGFDQDMVDGVDQGTDGFDTDGTNGVDDTLERETLPPYPYPIRGMQVSIRLVETDSKQVHQTSIIHSFVPE